MSIPLQHGQDLVDHLQIAPKGNLDNIFVRTRPQCDPVMVNVFDDYPHVSDRLNSDDNGSAFIADVAPFLALSEFDGSSEGERCFYVTYGRPEEIRYAVHSVGPFLRRKLSERGDAVSGQVITVNASHLDGYSGIYAHILKELNARGLQEVSVRVKDAFKDLINPDGRINTKVEQFMRCRQLIEITAVIEAAKQFVILELEEPEYA